MQQAPDNTFDFDEWAALAKKDPEAFEVRRQQEIARVIADAGPDRQARLKGLQWQLDANRKLSGNPLSSCVRIFNQMWSSVYGKHGLLEALNGLEGKPIPDLKSADIYELCSHRPDQHGNKHSLPSPRP